MFGQRLKNIREQRDWSQYDLADFLGLEQGTISRLERDEWEPSGPVKKLIDALEISAPPKSTEAA
jgi:transcriptional regulator with XRE-family HTH domain